MFDAGNKAAWLGFCFQKPTNAARTVPYDAGGAGTFYTEAGSLQGILGDGSSKTCRSLYLLGSGATLAAKVESGTAQKGAILYANAGEGVSTAAGAGKTLVGIAESDSYIGYDGAANTVNVLLQAPAALSPTTRAAETQSAAAPALGNAKTGSKPKANEEAS